MTNEQKLLALQVRINKLESRGDKNKKCPGALNRLKSEARTLEKTLKN